jgi:hypothetical protein
MSDLSRDELVSVLSARVASEYGGFCIVDAGDLAQAVEALASSSTARVAELAELAKLSEAASPGIWFGWPMRDGSKVCAMPPVDGDDPLTLADCDMDTRVDYDTKACANAAFIIACVNHARAALAPTAGETE